MLSAILFAGWVFIVPPYESDAQGIPQAQPRRAWKEWSQEGVFDQAQECEAARKAAIRQSQEASREAAYASVDDLEQKALKRARAVEDGYSKGRCIPADHLYPPAGPTKK